MHLLITLSLYQQKEFLSMSKTSSSSKQKYNSKVYKQVNVQLKNELVDNWLVALKEDGITKAEFVRNAIEKYLKERAD